VLLSPTPIGSTSASEFHAMKRLRKSLHPTSSRLLMTSPISTVVLLFEITKKILLESRRQNLGWSLASEGLRAKSMVKSARIGDQSTAPCRLMIEHENRRSRDHGFPPTQRLGTCLGCVMCPQPRHSRTKAVSTPCSSFPEAG
jgi:hypothetical protein